MSERKPKILYGKLSVFFETGYEGSIWAFEEDGKSGYDALHILKKGDLLKVFNDKTKKEVIFNSKIDFKTVKNPPFYIPTTLQKKISVKKWNNLFRHNKPAQLKLK